MFNSHRIPLLLVTLHLFAFRPNPLEAAIPEPGLGESESLRGSDSGRSPPTLSGTLARVAGGFLGAAFGVATTAGALHVLSYGPAGPLALMVLGPGILVASVPWTILAAVVGYHFAGRMSGAPEPAEDPSRVIISDVSQEEASFP